MNKISLLVFAVVALCALSAAHAQTTCNGTMRYEYRGQDSTSDIDFVDHVFAIEVGADVNCAKVDYELRVVEKPQDGEQVENKRSYTQSVRDNESKARKIKYRLARTTQVLDYSLEVTGCTPCKAP